MNESYPTCDDRLSPSSFIWSGHVTLKKKRIFVGLFRCISTLECIILHSNWLRGEEAPKEKQILQRTLQKCNTSQSSSSVIVIWRSHILHTIIVLLQLHSCEAVMTHISVTYYKHHLKESRPICISLYTMVVSFWLRSSEAVMSRIWTSHISWSSSSVTRSPPHVTLKKKRIFVGLFRCISTLECIILHSNW